ncbi:hypothetical protein [Microbispora sp. H10836]
MDTAETFIWGGWTSLSRFRIRRAGCACPRIP